jgi:hypothetical protein
MTPLSGKPLWADDQIGSFDGGSSKLLAITTEERERSPPESQKGGDISLEASMRAT